tara:strand:- start:32 stop:634 length:603 start_codon:yes stop_codon:yes gene_type:complete
MRGKTLGYEVRYPKGKDLEYKVNGEWVTRNMVPERREYEKKRSSSLERFISKQKHGMADRNKKWIRQKKYLLGENEFLEKGTSNKLLDHYKKQVERYGDKCPITLVKFTTVRAYQLNESKICNSKKRLSFSNLSPDRILNNINYTKQNTLFTSIGWNVARTDFTLEEFKYLFKDEVIERYKKILIERFPDQAYKGLDEKR